MLKGVRVVFLLLIGCGFIYAASPHDKEWMSTRVLNIKQHEKTGSDRYPYRQLSDYVLKELDLHEGDVVVDIGAGDGWWSQRMAPFVGPTGKVHAGEVEQKKVDRLKRACKDFSQIQPYLCPTDGTGLAPNSVDLVFLSQTFHHLDKDTRVNYLRHLRQVVKTTGRLCVIERYPLISTRQTDHGTLLSRLTEEAEQAGWVPVRYELMTGTYHFLALFVQKDLFLPENRTGRGR